MSEFELSQDIIERYNEDGAVLIKGAFTQEWIDLVTSGIEKNVSCPSEYGESLRSKPGEGTYFNDYCNWTRIEEFKEFAEKSPAAAIAGHLMKSRISVFYHEHVLIKEANASARTPWHHDQSYYPIDGSVCSLWMPLDPVSLETSIQFVRGSHKWGKWFYPRKFATSMNYQITSEIDRVYENVPEEEIESGKWEILSWSCEPGDVVAFQGLTLHGAPGNLAFGTRRILSTRWMGEDSTIATRPWDVSPPTRGGLKPGQRVSLSKDFPTLWSRRN